MTPKAKTINTQLVDISNRPNPILGEEDIDKINHLEQTRKQISAGYKGILDLIKNKHKTMRNNSHRYSNHGGK